MALASPCSSLKHNGSHFPRSSPIENLTPCNPVAAPAGMCHHCNHGRSIFPPLVSFAFTFCPHSASLLPVALTLLPSHSLRVALGDDNAASARNNSLESVTEPDTRLALTGDANQPPATPAPGSRWRSAVGHLMARNAAPATALASGAGVASNRSARRGFGASEGGERDAARARLIGLFRREAER